MLTACTATLFACCARRAAAARPPACGWTACCRAPGMRPRDGAGRCCTRSRCRQRSPTSCRPPASWTSRAAQAGVLFAVVNVSAAAARLVWGRLADRHGGTRRARTLAETGALAAGAALLMPLALRAGVVPSVVVACALSFGAFGFNGVLYVTAGEIAGAERAGRAVGVASTVVFGCTSALHAGGRTGRRDASATTRCGCWARPRRPPARDRGHAADAGRRHPPLSTRRSRGLTCGPGAPPRHRCAAAGTGGTSRPAPRAAPP